jgi:hypothetical protein
LPLLGLMRLGTLIPISLIGLLSTGCSTFHVHTGRCEAEFIELDWPIMIEQAGRTTTSRLSERIAKSNLGSAAYEGVKAALIRGEVPPGTAVMWSASAFNVNGGYIAVLLPLPVSAGQTLPVEGAFEGGGWGLRSVRAGAPATIALRSSDFSATFAGGSVKVMGIGPLSAHVDFTASNAANATIRIVGDAQFSVRNESVICD